MSTITPIAITAADERAVRDLVALAQVSQSDAEALPALHTADTAIDDIRLATPDVAIVSCTKTVHDGRAAVDDPDRFDMVGALTYVTVRGDDGWRIALAQTTPIITAPPHR